MEFEEFTGEMQRLGLRVCGKEAYGSREGYPFMVSYFSKTLCGVTFFVETGPGQELAAKLEKMLLEAVKDGQAVEEIAVKIPQTNKVQFEVHPDGNNEVGGLVDIVTGTAVLAFSQSGTAVPKGCPLCGRDGCDCYALVRGRYGEAHYACVEKAVARTKRREKSQNYPLGILGAVLGSFVGIIPTIISICASHKVVALLYALIPICAYYGYKLFRGKMTSVATGVVIVLSFVQVYIVMFITVYVAFLTNGYNVGIFEAYTYFQQFLASGDVSGTDVMKMIVFTVLGIIISWKTIRPKEAGVPEDMQTEIETATPIAGVTMPGATSEQPPADSARQTVPASAPVSVKEDIADAEAKKEKEPWEI